MCTAQKPGAQDAEWQGCARSVTVPVTQVEFAQGVYEDGMSLLLQEYCQPTAQCNTHLAKDNRTTSGLSTLRILWARSCTHTMGFLG